jgi:hypothetical protein
LKSKRNNWRKYVYTGLLRVVQDWKLGYKVDGEGMTEGFVVLIW